VGQLYRIQAGRRTLLATDSPTAIKSAAVMTVQIVEGDLLDQDVDVIVNA